MQSSQTTESALKIGGLDIDQRSSCVASVSP
jgi:hypothetical protein